MTTTAPRHGLLVLLGFLLGGWFGLAVAGLGLVAISRYRRWAVWLPVALLAVAAVTTVLPDVPTDGGLQSSYATDRPLAASAGLAAGILLAIVLVESLALRRAEPPTPDVDPEPPPSATERTALVHRHGPVVAGAIIAALLRVAVGGEALSGAEQEAVAVLRDGGGFTVSLPPVAVTLGAISPIGTTLLTALLAAAIVVTVGAIVGRLDGAASTPVAAVVTAFVPLTWALPLAATVGLLAVCTALLVLWDRAPTPGGAIIGGALLGLAVLARPELLLLALAVLTWCAVRPRPLRPGLFLAVTGAAVVAVVPWMAHVGHRTGTPGLASPLTDALDALGGAVGGPGVAALAVVATVAGLGAAVQQRRWLGRRLTEILPLVAGAVLVVPLLAVTTDVVALYPSVPFTVLAVARPARRRLAQRAR